MLPRAMELSWAARPINVYLVCLTRSGRTGQQAPLHIKYLYDLGRMGMRCGMLLHVQSVPGLGSV